MSKNPFKEALAKNEFVFTLELVPGPGSRCKILEDVSRLAEKAAHGGIIHALSITDNPGGHPALFPSTLGSEICRMGLNPIIHFTAKDKNRNQIASILYALNCLEMGNLLIMTGDLPLYGFEGKAKPVFDLDSLQILRMVGQMNAGHCIDENALVKECPPTHFFKGVVVSPFKKLEEEVFAQYFKLHKKLQMGADFIITQLGFDARKFDELLKFVRRKSPLVPVLGNVYILNRAVARIMRRGEIPGCVIPDELYRLIEKERETPDKGKKARLLRAAKLIAVLRGIGYNGVHLGGPNLKYEDVEWVVEKSKELVGNWEEWVREFHFPQKGGFYLYQKDSRTGLNTTVPKALSPPPTKKIGYRLMRLMHHYLFVPGTPLYKMIHQFYSRIDGTKAEKPFTEAEYILKFLTSRCRRCGDCTLPEMAFLCPQSQCPKYLFNGQCGGSRDGWCEVFPGERQCIFVRAYDRLKAFGEEKYLKEYYVPPRNWALDGISSWANYFLGRDYEAGKKRVPDTGVSPPQV